MVEDPRFSALFCWAAFCMRSNWQALFTAYWHSRGMSFMNNVLHFAKMHGLGNDFVVVDATKQPFTLDNQTIKTLADRHLGIGFDQLLVIELAKNADFFCRIFNADGSQAEQCGNGLRCIAYFLHQEKMLTSSSVTLETISGLFPISIQDEQHIHVTMGNPLIQKNLIELSFPSGHSRMLSIISMGNPHAIVKVNNLDEVQVEKVGMEIASHDYFPDGVNVGFMQIVDPHRIQLRTFERGSGETLACGSNACAAAAAGIINGWLQSPVQVEVSHGSLAIEWADPKPLQMIGSATHVFNGTICIR